MAIKGATDESAGPNVEAALSMSPTAAAEQMKSEARKPTIGNRKAGAKKGVRKAKA